AWREVLVLIWSDPVKARTSLTFFDLFLTCATGREVFPPEPPVAITIRPGRRAAVKGAPLFGAAKRTLDCCAPSWHCRIVDGRRSGNTFLLVGLKQVLFGTAGPM